MTITVTNTLDQGAGDESIGYGDMKLEYEFGDFTFVLPTESPVNVDEDRYKHFMGLLNKCVSEKNQAQELEMSVIRSFLSKNEKKKPFTEVREE